MEMTAEREGAILEAAIERWGDDRQVDKAIEEMAELTKALLKERQAMHDAGDTSKQDHVVEEIADVQIMLNQMQLIFGDCTDWEVRKLERLAARLEKEDGEA